jgi:hypothetical protein
VSVAHFLCRLIAPSLNGEKKRKKERKKEDAMSISSFMTTQK